MKTLDKLDISPAWESQSPGTRDASQGDTSTLKIAKNYQGIGLPLLDLMSEGNIGLLRAVDRFNPSKGAKSSGYSAVWIKQAIAQALANQSKAQLQNAALKKVRRRINNLENRSLSPTRLRSANHCKVRL